MILTQHFRWSASLPAKLVVFALSIAILPLLAMAVAQGENNDREDSAKQRSVHGKAKKEPPEAVVAHWRFQQGMIGIVASSSQPIMDSSGNDRHGYVVGGPKYRSVKLPTSNLALTFDGHDDRVFVPDDKIFHLTKSFTLEAYIQVDLYPESAAKFSFIVFRGDNRGGFDPWYLAVAESGQLTYLVSDALNNVSVVRSPEPIPTGELLHVAATLDDETGKQSLFINGKRVATTKTEIRAFGALGGSGPGIGIGNLHVHSVMAFRGTIDEVRITAAALGPGEFLAPPDL